MHVDYLRLYILLLLFMENIYEKHKMHFSHIMQQQKKIQDSRFKSAS